MSLELTNAQNRIKDLENQLQEATTKNDEITAYSKKLKSYSYVDEALTKNEELKTYSNKLKHENKELVEFSNNLDSTSQQLLQECIKLNEAIDKEVDKNRQAYNDGQQDGKLQIIDKWEHTPTRGSEMPLRKPEIYRHDGPTSFKRWLKSYIHFTNASKIPETKKVDCLITFLDSPSQSKVETLNLTRSQKSNFEDSCEKISRAIEGSTSRSEWRAKLFSARQEEDENITNFITRLNNYGERCYGTEASAIKNQILLDCLLSGIKSETIAVEIIKTGCDDYVKAYQQALDLEAIHNLRKVKPVKKEVKFEEDAELFAIQRDIDRPYYNNRQGFSDRQGSNYSRENSRYFNNDRQSYNNSQQYRNNRNRKPIDMSKFCVICKMNNHDTDECFFNRKSPNNCTFCGKRGHSFRECYSRLNQMSRNTPKATQSRGNYRQIQRNLDNYEQPETSNGRYMNSRSPSQYRGNESSPPNSQWNHFIQRRQEKWPSDQSIN